MAVHATWEKGERSQVRAMLLFFGLVGVLLLLAAGAAALVADSGAASFDRPGRAKPVKPARDHPDARGLVTALNPRLVLSVSSAGAVPAATTREGAGIPGASGGTTLILYDTTGPHGWLGELYASAVANLVSHFGPWRAEPVSTYTAGEIANSAATIYIGSTYDEPLPTPFLDDVYAATRPVVWVYDNIWALTSRYSSTFADRYGWSWSGFDLSTVSRVMYHGVGLTREGIDNGAGIMAYSFLDPAKAEVVALAVRADGTTFPWAVRSGMLTYVGENPFPYTTETDRLIAFEDMLFDVLAPATPTRHRALLRLEDVSPATDAATLRRVADYLDARGIPFGFGVTPVFTDPLAFEHRRPTTIRLRDSQIAPLVAYLSSHGGTLLQHGYTHQYDATGNPYNGVTGDDFELYRVVENADHSLTYVGPVTEDSTAWALQRVDAGAQELWAAGAGVARIWETPHYAASATAYGAIAQRFDTRWERALYFGGVLTGGVVDHGRVIGQLFPYVVRDLYGDVVLPENIGNYEPVPFYAYPVHTVADILAAADANVVVRDGFASFYYHPANDVGPLGQIVDGLLQRGWAFVSPATVAGLPPPVAPSNTTLPTITGTARSGQTLIGTSGTWTGDPAPRTDYQWLRCGASGTGCAAIPGATADRLTLGQKDVGSTIRVQVTATNAGGSATATSAPTAIVQRRR